MNVKQTSYNNNNIHWGQPTEIMCVEMIENNGSSKEISCSNDKKIKISPIYVVHKTSGDEVHYKVELLINKPSIVGKTKYDNFVSVTNEAFNISGNNMRNFMDFLEETFALEKVDVNTFVSVDTKSAVREILRKYQSDKTLFETLSMTDLDTLNGNVTLQNLKNIKSDMEANLDTAGEIEYWHPFLRKYSWILSQLFITPYILFQDEFCVGGQCYSKSGSTNTDFGMQNIRTGNCAIIEIKDAKKPLTERYRSNEITISNDVSGAISQLLKQKDLLYKSYWNNSRNPQNHNIEFEANNIKSILIIGKTPDDLQEKETFENFRNELKSVEIVTFDELLAKIDLQIKIIEGNVFN